MKRMRRKRFVQNFAVGALGASAVSAAIFASIWLMTVHPLVFGGLVTAAVVIFVGYAHAMESS